MIFQIYEHYNDYDYDYENNINNNDDNNDDKGECFICYEIKTFNGSKPILLKNQSIYYKFCNCDGLIHNECLDHWFRLNEKCPICRIKVVEKTNNMILLSYINNNRIIIYLFVKNSLMIVLRFLFICCIIFNTINLIMVFNNKKFLNNHSTNVTDIY